MKPEQIRKELKLGIDFVYKAIAKYKLAIKRLSNDQQPVEPRTIKTRDPHLFRAIGNYFEKNGIYKLSLPQLRKELLTTLEEKMVPTEYHLAGIC